MPAGVSRGAAQVLGVPQGMVVLQAAPQNNIPPQSNARPRSLSDPMAQFYALRDHVALFGYSVTKPSPGTDQSGSPDVTIQFTAKGAAAFQAMTARVAHRGDLVSGLGQTLNQHFAVALGDQLVTVPSIDFKTYPDGVPGDLGANITGGFDARTVRRAALEVQLGALPIALQLVSAPPSGG
jgi:preprotein translocase subunit SecD